MGEDGLDSRRWGDGGQDGAFDQVEAGEAFAQRHAQGQGTGIRIGTAPGQGLGIGQLSPSIEEVTAANTALNATSLAKQQQQGDLMPEHDNQSLPLTSPLTPSHTRPHIPSHTPTRADLRGRQSIPRRRAVRDARRWVHRNLANCHVRLALVNLEHRRRAVGGNGRDQNLREKWSWPWAEERSRTRTLK